MAIGGTEKMTTDDQLDALDYEAPKIEALGSLAELSLAGSSGSLGGSSGSFPTTS
ncbi:MAG TPA: hypothetical protein VME46_12830 [Acidimicrobiales bacterium]|nr:hypothetical protein [Acidimicrobiales bacterium]